MSLFLPPRTTGTAAEERAKSYLERQGLRTLERNFHSRRGEIDLVMQELDRTGAFERSVVIVQTPSGNGEVGAVNVTAPIEGTFTTSGNSQPPTVNSTQETAISIPMVTPSALSTEIGRASCRERV